MLFGSFRVTDKQELLAQIMLVDDEQVGVVKFAARGQLSGKLKHH